MGATTDRLTLASGIFEAIRDTAVIRGTRQSTRNRRFWYESWSGARDLNPDPHGHEPWAISSRNPRTIRFASKVLNLPDTPSRFERSSDRLLQRLLHGLDVPAQTAHAWRACGPGL